MLSRRHLIGAASAAAAGAIMPAWSRPAIARNPATKTPGITFAVDGVKAGTSALDLEPVNTALATLLDAKTKPLEAWSTRAPKLIKIPADAKDVHPFLLALNVAYDKHYPIVLSPDMIWLLIQQGVASHVTANAEALRHHFVKHKDKLQLHVKRDGFVLGNPENDWEGVFSEFSDKIRGHVGEATHNTMVAKFSTTSVVETAAMNIALMDSMQSYFVFSMSTACGFPSITLEGTPEDWTALRERAASLARFDLSWWTDHLVPVLRQFEAASRGQYDKDFWCAFYKRSGGSGGPFISGHVVNLFPYFGSARPTNERLIADYETALRNRPQAQAKTDAEIVKAVETFKAELSRTPDRGVGQPLTRNPWLGKLPERRVMSGMTADSVKTKLNSAPVIWNYHGKDLQFEFIAGMIGATQDAQTLAVRPEIGWAVRRGIMS